MFTLIFLLMFVCRSQSQAAYDIKYMIPGKLHTSPSKGGMERLSIYCYKGVPKHILHFFQTATLNLSLNPDQFTGYRGFTPEEVLEEFAEKRSFWVFNSLTWKDNIQAMNPFNSTCVGVFTSIDHTANLHILRIDFWRVLMFSGSVALYLTSPRLSANPLFYYACGVSFGVAASFLILFYLLYRFLPIPRGPAMYGIMFGGWTIGMYLFRLLWQNMQTLVLSYPNYVIAYLSTSAIVSFFICYRFGPVQDERTKRLIQWALQGFGLGGMFLSSQLPELSVAAILILIIYDNFPKSWITRARAAWHCRYPPKRRLLTEDEYYEQGAKETVNALNELREYCSSPECNQWKTMLRLKKPLRFAEFMEGKSHLSDDELLEYESEGAKSLRGFGGGEDSESD